MRDTGKPLEVGTISNEGATTDPQENFDVVISFRNIEGARLLQDMLNELVCQWSRESSPKSRKPLTLRISDPAPQHYEND